MSSKPAVKRVKSIHEDFAKFFDAPTREAFRELVKNHFGEFNHLDFKKDWPENWSKTAKHIFGIANSGGGCLVVGVEQTNGSLSTTGVTELVDKADISKKLKAYLPSLLLNDYEVLDFSFEAAEYSKLVGKTFQVLLVGDMPEHLPFVSASNGSDIREGSIYVRRGTSTEEANYEELQRVLNRRIETNTSSQAEIDLQAHFDQLKLLYGLMKSGSVVPRLKFGKEIAEVLADFGKGLTSTFQTVPNPLYPKESIDEFVARLIAKKKRKIEFELQVDGIGD